MSDQTFNDNSDLSSLITPEERSALGIEDGEKVTLDSMFESEGVAQESEVTGSIDEVVTPEPKTPIIEPEQKQVIAIEQTAPAITVEPISNLDVAVKTHADAMEAARAAQTTAESALLEKYEGGELNAAEYNEAIKSERIKADNAVMSAIQAQSDVKAQHATFLQQSNAQTEFYKSQWLAEVNQFCKSTAQTDGINYQNPETPFISNAFNAEVQRLNTTEPSLTNGELLKKAHEVVKAQLVAAGISPKAATKKAVIPPNIGSMPSSAGSIGSESSKTSHLDSMVASGKGGFEFEKAAAAMSSDELEAWAFSES
jgi:hypothetical protein